MAHLHFVRRTALALVLAVGLVPAVGMLASDANAETKTTLPPASAFLKTKHETVTNLIKATAKTPADEKKNSDAIDGELDKLVDYTRMAKDALGAEYDKRTDKERSEFTDLLKQLIKKNYKKKLKDTQKYLIEYTSEETVGAQTIVHTKATNTEDKRDTEVLIDYVVEKKDKEFIVVDLKPENASMIKTYNKEFTKALKKGSTDGKDGWPDVIKKMKDKLAAP